MIELLAPAGSPEALEAAVKGGADAVYLGGADFNARRRAKNFTPAEIEKAIETCHEKKVKVFLTLNTLLSDRELGEAVPFVRRMSRAGVDAFIVADLGVAGMIRAAAPDVPLHASTQAGVHNLEGVREMEKAGFSRVILARELNKAEIAYIARNTSLELEMFVHGALCMSYSGQCAMSAVIGRRSGNRGMCAQPCRLAYTFGGSTGERPVYPLSPKDLSLADKMDELEKIGVKSLKIEGRMRSPAYVATVTSIYSRLIDEHRGATPEERALLEEAFSRGGFTDGYYEGRIGPAMFGVRGEGRGNPRMLAHRRSKERTSEPLVFYCIAKTGEPLRLAAEDECGNRVACAGATPEPAKGSGATEEELKTQLARTGGSGWHAKKINLLVDEGLFIQRGDVNDLRRRCVALLNEKRDEAKRTRRVGEFRPGVVQPGPRRVGGFIFSFSKLSQLSSRILSAKPRMITLPAAELAEHRAEAEKLAKSGIPLAAVFPRVLHDDEVDAFRSLLDGLDGLPIEAAYVGNAGMFSLAREKNYAIRGDFGLNVYNSQTIKEYKKLGVKSVTLSFELTLPRVRDLSKPIETELLAYGRLPLMLTENCILKNHKGVCGACATPQTLRDRNGEEFCVVKEYGCRSVILNAHKLFLADRLADFNGLGLTALRLLFTTESAPECLQVVERYLGKGDYEPTKFTTGLYYRGVE